MLRMQQMRSSPGLRSKLCWGSSRRSPAS